MNCILCGADIPAHLVNHPRTKFCGVFCRNKAQRIKDKDKRAAYLAAWKAKNPDRVKELRRESARRCHEAGYVRRKEWGNNNPERVRNSRKKWIAKNPGKRASDVRSRQLAKSRAEPAWLSKEQKNQIAEYYKEAARLTKNKGVPHEVDHIVPIRGKVVCGLHVPWNLQVLTSTENRRKSAIC